MMTVKELKDIIYRLQYYNYDRQPFKVIHGGREVPYRIERNKEGDLILTLDVKVTIAGNRIEVITV